MLNIDLCIKKMKDEKYTSLIIRRDFKVTSLIGLVFAANRLASLATRVDKRFV